MSDRHTPQLARAYEILADGEWHERESVMREMYPKILPGQAVRAVERSRVKSGGTARNNPPQRVKLRSTEFLVASGRRMLAKDALRAPRVEHKTEDGVKYVRLRPASTERLTREQRLARGLYVRPPAVPEGQGTLEPEQAPQPARVPRLTSAAKPARQTITPYMAAAYEVLADGDWADRETVLDLMYDAIPAADALAVVEYKRVWRYIKDGVEPKPRTREISEERLVISGRRSIALEGLNNNARIERRIGPDGRQQIRLRPAMPVGRPGPNKDQLELGGGIEPHS